MLAGDKQAIAGQVFLRAFIELRSETVDAYISSYGFSIVDARGEVYEPYLGLLDDKIIWLYDPHDVTHWLNTGYVTFEIPADSVSGAVLRYAPSYGSDPVAEWHLGP